MSRGNDDARAGESWRLLNRDGSFNISRRGGGERTRDLYHRLLSMGWPRFFAITVAFYLFANAVFALGYLLCGPNALQGASSYGTGKFLDAFFFSVQTLSTIGYGKIMKR